MGWKTIRIPEDDFERHNEQRKKAGMTWAEYIDSQEPEWITGSNIEFERIDPVIDYDRIREIVREETRQVLSEIVR